MTKIVRNIFVAWIMILALVAPTARVTKVKAQTLPSLTIQSAFSQVCHNHPTQCSTNPRVVGRNNYYSLYPLGGVTFPATSSGACNFANGHYDTTCNNVQVNMANLDAGGQQLCELSYVSPTQINLIARNVPVRDNVTGTWPVERNEVSVANATTMLFTHQQVLNFDSFLTLPAGDFNAGGTFCQRGDVYNAVTGAYIQYAGNCSAFPRTASGQPTIVQIYFGGLWNFGVDAQHFDVTVNGTQVITGGTGYISGNQGWDVINVSPPAGGWLVGNNTVKITSSLQGPYSETAVLVGAQ